MSEEAQIKREALAARYNLAGQPEWQQFLKHFALSEDFALIVLLVVDAAGAELCREELAKQLLSGGKTLVSLDISSPKALRDLPTQLLATRLPASTGGLWIAAVTPDYAKDFSAWREAWQLALARLNPRRNEIRRQFNCAIIFVGAPWLQETLREIAPDLWSVRTLVARIESQTMVETKIIGPERIPYASSEVESGGDPLFALQEAEKLRGVPGTELALAQLLHRAGEGFVAREDWRAAEKAYSEALTLKQQFGAPPESQLATLLELAKTCNLINQTQESLNYAQLALILARRTGDQRSECKALTHLGNAYSDSGQLVKAIEFYKEALMIGRAIGDQHEEVNVLNNLGKAFSILGNTQEAIRFYRQEQIVARQIGYRLGEANALGNLGTTFHALGDLRQAIELFEQSLAIAREIGDQLREIYCLNNLGLVQNSLGNTHKAIEVHKQALIIARNIRARFTEVIILGNLGIDFDRLGEISKALEFFELSLVAARAVGDAHSEANALWNSANTLWNLGEQVQAVSRAEAALKIYETFESPVVSQIRTKLAEWREAVKSF